MVRRTSKELVRYIRLRFFAAGSDSCFVTNSFIRTRQSSLSATRHSDPSMADSNFAITWSREAKGPTCRDKRANGPQARGRQSRIADFMPCTWGSQGLRQCQAAQCAPPNRPAGMPTLLLGICLADRPEAETYS